MNKDQINKIAEIVSQYLQPEEVIDFTTASEEEIYFWCKRLGQQGKEVAKIIIALRKNSSEAN